MMIYRDCGDMYGLFRMAFYIQPMNSNDVYAHLCTMIECRELVNMEIWYYYLSLSLYLVAVSVIVLMMGM